MERTSHSLVTWTQVVYALHAFSLLTGIIGTATVVGAFLTGWPSVIAVILNYIKRSEARDTWLESHFRWQINKNSRLTSARGQRVRPFEIRKSREIAIGGVEDCAVLEGHGRENSIHDYRTDSLPFPHQALQDVPVAVTWLQNSYVWLGEPGRHRRFRLGHGERTFEGARIR